MQPSFSGQNPTGTTPPLHRLKAIYSVCQKHDVVIVEDDPYHFLQFSPYGSQKVSEVDSSQPLTPTAEESAVKQKSISTFANTLTKSLLSIDVDGRVVRIDTFSKVIFPGARLGWVTCNQVFKERIERITEVTTQVGNGVNQAFFSQLLTEPSKEGSNTGGWGITGLLRWINQIRRYVLSFKFDLLL